MIVIVTIGATEGGIAAGTGAEAADGTAGIAAGGEIGMTVDGGTIDVTGTITTVNDITIIRTMGTIMGILIITITMDTHPMDMLTHTATRTGAMAVSWADFSGFGSMPG